jgi:hypothetical protein
MFRVPYWLVVLEFYSFAQKLVIPVHFAISR